MNYSRLALAAAAAWVVDGLYGFVVYGNLLANEFAQYPGVFRPLEAMNAKMPFLFAGLLLVDGRRRVHLRERIRGRHRRSRKARGSAR